MKKFIFIAIASIFSIASFAQETKKPIFYSVSFPNAVHHEAEIVITIPSAPAKPFIVRMSRSSAGRYATHEFGKNIYNVKATEIDGTPVPLKQLEGDVFEVGDHTGDAVKISYTLFANWTDGTYASID
jgi:predicted metalloprotease with PDZ domain